MCAGDALPVDGDMKSSSGQAAWKLCLHLRSLNLQHLREGNAVNIVVFIYVLHIPLYNLLSLAVPIKEETPSPTLRVCRVRTRVGS